MATSMASSVKTRKMTAHKGQDPKRTGPSKSPTKITKYTIDLARGTNKTQSTDRTNQNAMSTPTRRRKSTKEKVRDDPLERDTESEADEISVHSDDLAENVDNDIPFASLGELEQIYTTDIDPRELAFSNDTVPLILLSYLIRIDKLEEKQEELESENQNLKGSLDFAYNKIEDLEKKDSEQAESIKRAHEMIESINNTNTKLKVDAQRNKDRNIRAETYSRRQNLRLEGIPTTQNETTIQCRNIAYNTIKNSLGIEDVEERIVIEKCHRDKKFPNQEPPSILIRFLSLRDRQEVWDSRERVNRDRSNKIYINEDFPQEVEKKRSFLRPYLRAAYASKRRATLNGDTLIVESNQYTVDTLHLLPDDIKPEKVAVKTVGDVSAFYRSDAFLSNFHPAPFEIENTKYCSVEQFYMCKKAEEFNDTVAKNKIMATKNPGEINFLSKGIANFNQTQWKLVEDAIMKQGVNAKFDQNPHLQNLLLETGNTTLVEASPRDKNWGVGININDKRIFDPKNWQGANKLGKILMECRNRLGARRD